MVSLSKEQLTVLDYATGKSMQGVFIRGVAGSMKTEILVLIGIRLYLQGELVSFLTKVTSVTQEIKTRIMNKLPGATFVRKGNHFTLVDQDTDRNKGGAIEVANLDAAIHTRLLYEGVDMQDVGDQHDEKARHVVEMGLKDLRMVDGRVARVVIVDELQDVHPSRSEALVQLLQDTDSIAHGAGNMLQLTTQSLP